MISYDPFLVTVVGKPDFRIRERCESGRLYAPQLHFDALICAWIHLYAQNAKLYGMLHIPHLTAYNCNAVL